MATWLDFATPGVKGAYFPIIRSRRAYNPFEEDVFTCGLIYLFICSIRLQLGNLDGSKAAFDHAAEVVRKQRPQFLIPDVGTYLFDNVQIQIKSLAGWILPGNVSVGSIATRHNEPFP